MAKNVHEVSSMQVPEEAYVVTLKDETVFGLMRAVMPVERATNRTTKINLC